MKKTMKVSLAAVAVLLFCLNVAFNMNGNKVEGLNLSTNVQTALAYDHCELELDDYVCYCEDHDYYCAQVCGTIYVRRCWDGE